MFQNRKEKNFCLDLETRAEPSRAELKKITLVIFLNEKYIWEWKNKQDIWKPKGSCCFQIRAD